MNKKINKLKYNYLYLREYIHILYSTFFQTVRLEYQI